VGILDQNSIGGVNRTFVVNFAHAGLRREMCWDPGQNYIEPSALRERKRVRRIKLSNGLRSTNENDKKGK
jgi:hypothetical protein